MCFACRVRSAMIPMQPRHALDVHAPTTGK
jgi:hypothetical protein